ncbi:MAG: hypothetical protein ACQES9_00065 [Myxococcota bacterium]
MTPFEVAMMASGFLVILMFIMSVMLFFSINFKKNNFHKPPKLFFKFENLYKNRKILTPPLLNKERIIQKSENLRSSGKLIRARYFANIAGELSDNPNFCPEKLKEVLLPDINKIEKPISNSLLAQHISHPQLHNLLTPTFVSISKAQLEINSHPTVNYNLKSQDKASNYNKNEIIIGYFSKISKILLGFEPQIFYKNENINILHANTQKNNKWYPSLLFGNKFLFSSTEEQIFLLASKLALFRPELRIILCYPTEKKFADFADKMLNYPNSSLKTEIMEKIHPEDQKKILKFLTENEIEISDFINWRKGAILTANRLGFIFANDFNKISSLLKKNGELETKLDLMSYIISERFIKTLINLKMIPE